MKKLLLPLLLSAICLTGCTFDSSSSEPEDKTHYYTLNETAENKDDNITLTLTQVSVHGIVYPGTKDLRPLEFYLDAENKNTSGSVYFSLSNFEWILYVGEYTYVCNEINGTKNIEAGGKGVIRPWFDVPDNVYQNNDDIKLKMNRPYRSLLDTVKYEFWWKIDKPQ